MKRWNTARLHRWTAVATGVVLFVWIATGLVMILRPFTPNGVADRVRVPDPLQAVVSPAGALSMASASVGGSVRARGVDLVVVGDRWVYQIRTVSHGRLLVDAAHGGTIRIDPLEAGRIADLHMEPGLERLAGVDSVFNHDAWYMYGDLPAYRFRYANGSRVHVVMETGATSATDAAITAREVFQGLHTFSVLNLVARVAVDGTLIWVFSLVSVFVIGSGYWLAYPPFRAWRRRRARS